MKIEFFGELSRIQRSLATCADMVARRAAILEELKAQYGKRILDLGCGAGLYAREIAASVGPNGQPAGIANSEDQITAAAAQCEGMTKASK